MSVDFICLKCLYFAFIFEIHFARYRILSRQVFFRSMLEMLYHCFSCVRACARYQEAHTSSVFLFTLSLAAVMISSLPLALYSSTVLGGVCVHAHVSTYMFILLRICRTLWGYRLVSKKLSVIIFPFFSLLPDF